MVNTYNIDSLIYPNGGEMTTYKDLCNAWEADKKASEKTMQAMAKLLGRFVEEIKKDLGLEKRKWKEEEGQEVRYVRTGIYKNGELDYRSPLTMPIFRGKDQEFTLPFFISVTLETAPNEFPKLNISTTFTLINKNGDFSIKVGDKDDDYVFKLAKHCSDEEMFQPVIDEMKQRILRKYQH